MPTMDGYIVLTKHRDNSDLLHDIGKVGLADEILKMLGKVEPKERGVMRPKYFDSEVAKVSQAGLDDFRNFAACCRSQEGV